MAAQPVQDNIERMEYTFYISLERRTMQNVVKDHVEPPNDAISRILISACHRDPAAQSRVF